MKGGLRSHLLIPAPTPSAEVARKQVLAKVVVGVGLKSGSYILNKLITAMGDKIRASMRVDKKYGGTHKDFFEDTDFCTEVFVPYLIASGVALQRQRNNSGFVFTSDSFETITKAIGGSQYYPNRQDPFTNFTLVTGTQAFHIQKQQLGYVGLPVVRNPKTSNKDALLTSMQIEMGVLPVGCSSMVCDELVHMLVKHRIEFKTFLGMSYVHSLEVSQTFPFTITLNPGRRGQLAIKIRYRLHKDKVVFTLNQPTVLERKY